MQKRLQQLQLLNKQHLPHHIDDISELRMGTSTIQKLIEYVLYGLFASVAAKHKHVRTVIMHTVTPSKYKPIRSESTQQSLRSAKAVGLHSQPSSTSSCGPMMEVKSPLTDHGGVQARVTLLKENL